MVGWLVGFHRQMDRRKEAPSEKVTNVALESDPMHVQPSSAAC